MSNFGRRKKAACARFPKNTNILRYPMHTVKKGKMCEKFVKRKGIAGKEGLDITRN